LAGAFGQGGGHRAERLESEILMARQPLGQYELSCRGPASSGISHVVHPSGAGGGAPKEGARLKGELAMERVVGRGRQPSGGDAVLRHAAAPRASIYTAAVPRRTHLRT